MNKAMTGRPLRRWISAVTVVLIGGMLPAGMERVQAQEPLEDPIPEKIEKGDVRVELELVAEGLHSPVYLTHSGDESGRLFVVDQAGTIHVIRDGEMTDEPFLDLTDELVDLREGFDERGLLGLAFHPGFADSDSPGHRKLYTYSSQPVEGQADFSTDAGGAGHDHQSVIEEWQVESVDSSTVDKSSRREIMRVDQPQFNHDGGMLAFGPDGMLYIGFGDGGAGNDLGPGHVEGGNGQEPANILGTIARIDPLGQSGEKSDNGRYSIPEDNPFVGDDQALDEVWAYGLRNPWRFSFDAETDDLVAADVGQGKIEEVDIIEPGGNYGWRIKEGTFYFDPDGAEVTREKPTGSLPEMIDPVAQYDHDEGLSITGGYVYRGEAIPDLVGQYVFGDWRRPDGKGRLFYTDLADGEIHEFILGSNDRDLDVYVSGFGTDADHEIYVTTNTETGPLSGGGQIWKIVPVE